MSCLTHKIPDRLRAPFDTKVAETSLTAIPRAESELSKLPPHVDHASATLPKSLEQNAWRARFYTTDDLFQFVKQAASAAIHNKDGRAAYFVGESLNECASVYHAAKRDPNFEENFDSEYAKMAPKAADWMRIKAKREFQRCVQLVKENPFADLPPRADGYKAAKFWTEQALSDGDPLEQAHQANLIVAEARYKDAEHRKALLQKAQQLVDSAARSKDPDALYMIGQVLTDGRNSADYLRGAAISLAACSLGYDCTADNPANSFAVCKYSGTCPADADYAFFLQQSLGPGDFATAYAKSQNFLELLSRKDWDGIDRYIALDGSLASNN